MENFIESHETIPRWRRPMADVYAPERKLKREMKDAWEGDYFTHVCRYLRETIDQTASGLPEAALAKKLVDIIEGVVS